MNKNKKSFLFVNIKNWALAAWHSGHRVRLENRSSWVQTPTKQDLSHYSAEAGPLK
jgi:hypothetical protein